MHRSQLLIKPGRVMTKQEGRCTANTLPNQQLSYPGQAAHPHRLYVYRPTILMIGGGDIILTCGSRWRLVLYMSTDGHRPLTFRCRAQASEGLHRST